MLRLVELGEARERLGADERSVVDARVRASINAVPPDVFSAYSDGLDYYRREGEAEVAELIADFNIITQYADFELLKKQEPLEAERLGID